MAHMIDNSRTDGPLQDSKISKEPSWQGLPSDDKKITGCYTHLEANSQKAIAILNFSL